MGYELLSHGKDQFALADLSVVCHALPAVALLAAAGALGLALKGEREAKRKTPTTSSKQVAQGACSQVVQLRAKGATRNTKEALICICLLLIQT